MPVRAVGTWFGTGALPLAVTIGISVYLNCIAKRFKTDTQLDFPQFHPLGRHVITQKISS
jgi:hypothetical protein